MRRIVIAALLAAVAVAALILTLRLAPRGSRAAYGAPDRRRDAVTSR